jgi:sulfate adenylyltransferase subunit 1
MLAYAAQESDDFAIEEFLERERTKSLLRFTTAGSVDDGKSTLIGRLLYDSRNVYEDQVASIAKSTVNRSAGKIDLSLLTDGLRAEREQGITIDVAYRYFATARRKFIIADTPGHEQYTRNMATGASTADLAIVLIDARNGVQPQSRRHAYIAALLGIPRCVIAVNKMDLVDFSESVFDAIREEFSTVLARLGVVDSWFVPISALTGDNVVNRSAAMEWFEGPSLLEYLETVEIPSQADLAPFRFPVQRVIRPDQHFRGYAGQIASGTIRPGDAVTVWPSGRRTRIRTIETWDGERDCAFAPMSVVLTLEEELDISRGDLIAGAAQSPELSRSFEAHVVWMHEQPLDPSRPYLFKHTTQTVQARVGSIAHRVDINTLEPEDAAALPMNGIGLVRVETARRIAFDAYTENRITGSAILIDPATNATAGALMIGRAISHDTAAGPVSASERAGRFGHRSSVFFVGPRKGLAAILERRLFDRGANVAVLHRYNDEIAAALGAANVLAIVVGSNEPTLPLLAGDDRAADQVIRWLEIKGIVNSENQLGDGEGI